MSVDRIRHRREAGRWHVLLPGIYSTTGPHPTDRQRLQAALLYGGKSAQLTGLTACRLHEIRYLPPAGGLVYVLVDHAVRHRSSDFVVVQGSIRLPHPVIRAGLPATPVRRAVIDASRSLRRLQDVRAIIADSVHRGLVTPEELAEELKDSHSAGSRLPRIAVDDMIAGVRSAPEAELRDLVRTSAVLPEPEWNARIVDDQGFLVAIADALWRKVKMAAEMNSYEHHSSRDAWEATMRRQARLASHEYLVVPISPYRLRTTPSIVLRELEAAYLARLDLFDAA